MKKKTTRTLNNYKANNNNPPLQMLTCYDYQTATLLDEMMLDMILVGDSLGNVILGYENTIAVTLEEMIIFSAAVKRGAKNKFVIADMPFGTYPNEQIGMTNAIKLFQKTGVEALKIEGAGTTQLKLIKQVQEIGIPIMGHIGLIPQSVNQQGGYYTHGTTERSADRLVNQAMALEKAGCFGIVLECISREVAKKITALISIPTIGIGSGNETDGQVLVINDLLNLGKHPPPKFVRPIANLYGLKKQLLEIYLNNQRSLDKRYSKPDLLNMIPSVSCEKKIELKNGEHTHH